MRSKLLSFLVFCLLSDFVIGNRWVVERRQDGSSVSSTAVLTTSSRRPTQDIQSTRGSKTEDGSVTKTSSQSRTTSTISFSSSNSITASSTQQSVMPSNINGPAATSLVNSSLIYNATATPGKLPITPRITPSFCVGGVLLLASGLLYTLMGIKNKMLHIFLSATYLASLAVTVLIIYVMNPPVSDAVQGAYLVAIVMTGLIIGGGAIIFMEMTEGLGCLLGGFCFSMWLLVLKPGGLLTSTGGIAGLIAAFSLAAFATSFSHITRPYGLMICVSFAGATVMVIGIDCFSRAGLKEFWAYIWKLNDNLFPLGATTYPHTRGIKVEIAAIVLLFLAGVIAQVKIWKVIRERREQRAAERLADERTHERQEEKIARRIVAFNERERYRWEAAYGDQNAAESVEEPRDSGVGDMESQKHRHISIISATTRHSNENEIEMGNMSPRPPNSPGLVIMNKDQEEVNARGDREIEPPKVFHGNGKKMAISRNQPDEETEKKGPPQQYQEEQVWIVGTDDEVRQERRLSMKAAVAPEVVPLPFKVIQEGIKEDLSSVATFADDEEATKKRFSTYRLSATGSAIMRKLSERSKKSPKIISQAESNVSQEELIVGDDIDDDRASSLAATLDCLSDDEETRSTRSSLHFEEDTESRAKSGEADDGISPPPPTLSQVTGEQEPPSTKLSNTPEATALKDGVVDEPKAQFLALTTESKGDSATVTNNKSSHPENKDHPRDIAASVISAPETIPTNLTKDSLPARLSKVVMSYRTNEWAKHLSTADAPEPEDLKLEDNSPEKEVDPEESEVAAPVNVEELQKTSEATLGQSATSISGHQGKLSNSRLTKSPSTARRDISGSSSQGQTISRASSVQSFRNQPPLTYLNNRSSMFRNSSAPNIPRQINESPIEQTYSPNQTYGSTPDLAGRRDTITRGKSYGNISPLASTPELRSSTFYSSPISEISSYSNNFPNPMNGVIDDDNMSLRERREMIRQASLSSKPYALTRQNTFDSHQPKRQSSVAHPLVRETQLASWRTSVHQDLTAAVPIKHTIERQRSALWQERRAEEQKKVLAERRKEEMDSAFDERMRRGDMLDAHREAMRKMQASANKHI